MRATASAIRLATADSIEITRFRDLLPVKKRTARG
jgi:hypothetical protein